MTRPRIPWRPIARRYPERSSSDPLAGFVDWLFEQTPDDFGGKILARGVCYLVLALVVVNGGRALGWW